GRLAPEGDRARALRRAPVPLRPQRGRDGDREAGRGHPQLRRPRAGAGGPGGRLTYGGYRAGQGLPAAVGFSPRATPVARRDGARARPAAPARSAPAPRDRDRTRTDRSRCRSIPRARAGAAAAAWGRDRPAARPGRRSEVVPSRPLPCAGAAEAPGAPFARGEFLDDVEADLQDGDDQQLGDPFEGLDREGGVAAVPDRYHQLALVVRIDQADEVPEDDAMLVAEAGARQYQRGEARIADVDRDAGRHQCARPRGERQRLVEAGAKVEAGAARAAVGGQPLAHPGVEDLEFDFHAVSS